MLPFAEFLYIIKVAAAEEHQSEKSERKLVGKLNRQFAEMAGMQRFATALVMTYLASHDRLSVCNAGHPRPLHYRARERSWSAAGRSQPESHEKSCPVICHWDSTTRPSIETFDVALGRGDLVAFYTDALSEAANPAGKLLGEEGLLEVARRLDLSDSRPGAIGPALLEAVSVHREHRAADDDVTLVILNHNASPTPRLSLGEKVDVYAKVFGLKSV